MRCPKCHYISYDASDRCRNCGYEFSLAADAGPIDLPIQTGDEPLGPLSDLTLVDRAVPHAAAASPRPAVPKAAGALDLPLFKDRAIDDRPLVTPPAVPRAPLSVRKSTPAVARPAHQPVEEPEFDLGPAAAEEPARPSVNAPARVAAEEATAVATGSLGRRLAAAVIDVALLALVDASILYFTLRLCGLQLADIRLIPPVPFLSFLLLQNGGYFVAFVAVGGQTLGKMALGIKVVPDAAGDGWTDGVPLGTAVVRAAAWFLTVVPAGIGLIPALISTDRRAVHDRLAGTRVVKA